MQPTLKDIEIIKFKSISNPIKLSNLSVNSNVVYVPMNSKLRDDLIEAVQYGFGREMRVSQQAEVIVTYTDMKLSRCRIANRMPNCKYYAYDMDANVVSNYGIASCARQEITRKEYLAKLGLIAHEACIIDLNGRVKALASTANVAPILEQMCGSIARESEWNEIQREKAFLIYNQTIIQSYRKFLRNRQKHFNGFDAACDQFEKQIKRQENSLMELTQLTTFIDGTNTPSIYYDENSSVNYNYIRNELTATLDTQSMRFVHAEDINNKLLNNSNMAISIEIIANEEVDLRGFFLDFRENARNEIENQCVEVGVAHQTDQTTIVENATATRHFQTECCRHQNELHTMQAEINAKLDDCHVCLENIRPIIIKKNCVTPRRFREIIRSVASDEWAGIFDSIAFESLSQMIIVRDEQQANSISTEFAAKQIKTVDLMVQADLVPQGTSNIVEHDKKIPADAWVTSDVFNETALPTECILNFLETYSLCASNVNAAALVAEYSPKIAIIRENGATLNDLGIIGCGRSDAFNKTEKIICLTECIRFSAFAVVKLTQVYPMVRCLQQNVRNGCDSTPHDSALQTHQNGLHVASIDRIKSKFRAWQISDLQKTIEFMKNDLEFSSRSENLESRLKINPLGDEKATHLKLKDMFVNLATELSKVNKIIRVILKSMKKLTARATKMETNRTGIFVPFFRGLSESVHATYKQLLNTPAANLILMCANETTPHLNEIIYVYQYDPHSSLRETNSDSNRYMAALAIMLRINEMVETPLLILDDFGTLLSDKDLHELLLYIFRQPKQKIAILSRTNDTTKVADRVYWLHQNEQNECEILDSARLLGRINNNR